MTDGMGRIAHLISQCQNNLGHTERKKNQAREGRSGARSPLGGYRDTVSSPPCDFEVKGMEQGGEFRSKAFAQLRWQPIEPWLGSRLHFLESCSTAKSPISKGCESSITPRLKASKMPPPYLANFCGIRT